MDALTFSFMLCCSLDHSMLQVSFDSFLYLEQDYPIVFMLKQKGHEGPGSLTWSTLYKWWPKRNFKQKLTTDAQTMYRVVSSSGCHLVHWSQTVWAILVDGHRRNIPVKSFQNPSTGLTLILLNNLINYIHFWLSANQIISYNVFVQIHKLNDKQCRSWSDGFFRSHLIWIYFVCKGRGCREQQVKGQEENLFGFFFYF